MSAYFQNINKAIKTTIKGMGLTFKHLLAARKSRSPLAVNDLSYFEQKSGIVTLQYPKQQLPIPENGRYQLDCEIDDCIVCDKCAKVCPVDCIEIEAIKSSEVINYASDGSPIRLYAAKFDIDMAKCCFCGLCTTVCPTECLTMTNTYDFSVFDINEMNFAFSKLSDEEADEKRKLYEQFVAEKEAAKKQSPIEKREVSGEVKPKAVFKPSIKSESLKEEIVKNIDNQSIAKPKPVFKPTIKVADRVSNESEEEKKQASEQSSTAKPVFKPSFQAKKIEASKDESSLESKPKASFKPKFKPSAKNMIESAEKENMEQKNSDRESSLEAQPKIKVAFKPKMKIVPKKEE